MQTIFLPASNIHYGGTGGHGGNLWGDVPSLLAEHLGIGMGIPGMGAGVNLSPGNSPSNDEEEEDRRRQPCTCGAQDTYGIQFEKLSLNCGFILKAHEEAVGLEEKRRERVIYI